MKENDVVREMIAAARELAPFEPKLAMSIIEEAKALKMKGVVMELMDDVKHFRGTLNRFLKDLPAMVKDPKSLRAFPELKDIIELSDFLKRKVLRHTFLSPNDIAEKMLGIVEADAQV